MSAVDNDKGLPVNRGLWVVILVVLPFTAWLVSAVAQEPAEEREVNIRLPARMVIAAANAQMKSIEDAKFSTTTHERSARVLALLAQAIIDNDEDTPERAFAPAMRDAALTLAKAESAAEAKKILAEMKNLKASSPVPPPNQYDLTQLADIPTLMEEIQSRSAKLGKVVRSGAKDPNAMQHAVVASVLGIAVGKHRPESQEQKDIDSWREHAHAVQVGFARLRVALEEANAADSKKSFERIGKSCHACHDKFKPE